jgi:polypyrimidine tract-binding protein 2
MSDKEGNAPSKVIHFRNVTPDITQNDLLLLASPFGAVEQVVMMRSRNQALMQMKEVSSAINLMQYFSNVQAHVRGRNLYLRFSRHQELTADNNANRIILITLQNPHFQPLHSSLYPVTVDLLWHVFAPNGFIEKIVIINKSAGLQALVQYHTTQEATKAKNALQGTTMYAGPEIGVFTLDIQYSNLKELTVKQNTDKTRDFTNPLLPVNVSHISHMQSLHAQYQAAYGYNSAYYAAQAQAQAIENRLAQQQQLQQQMHQQLQQVAQPAAPGVEPDPQHPSS